MTAPSQDAPGSASLDPANLRAIFKAYDVRGLVGDQIDAALARAVGAAFVAEILDPPAAPAGSGRTIVVGHDMRPSSPELAAAFADGATSAGADVVMIGLASTDQLYFASGRLEMPGVMFTASHNPAAYNGIKLCRAGAAPIGRDTGLGAILERLESGDLPVAAEVDRGTVTERDLLADYADHLVALAPLPSPVRGRRLKVVADAGNGMAGHTAPAVFDLLADSVQLIPMYFELDGTFPHHEANPIDPTTLVDLQRGVRDEGADVGLAFDGDADRCFLVDERGELVSPSTLTALIAARELERDPGAAIIHNLITSRAVPAIVSELGGRPVRTRVGHSFIKATMAETNAIFGGEHSGHFYFRDFWRADSGMLAALHALAALAAHDGPLSDLLADYERFVVSGEINSTVDYPAAVLETLERRYADDPGVRVDHLDGLTIEHDDWWFNVRASNTEPLLRLNAEGNDQSTMSRVRDDVLAIIRSQA